MRKEQKIKYHLTKIVSCNFISLKSLINHSFEENVRGKMKKMNAVL